MPQLSHAYACARISALSKRLLDASTVRRMADGTYAEAVRALADLRYGGLSDTTEVDAERIIETEMTEAMEEVKALTPEPVWTDLFLLRTDVQNLKVLLKARMLGRKEDVWAYGGLYSRELLTAMVAEQKYQTLPDAIRDALNALERKLLQNVDPQRISVDLDRAYLAHCLKVSKKHPVFSQYFRAIADFDNVLTFLRMRAMGASKNTLDDMLLPEGGIRWKSFEEAYELSNESLNRILFESVCKDALLEGLNAMQRTGNLAEIEKARANYTLSLFTERRYEIETIYPVIGYYLAKEREGRAIRLILTAKRNGLGESIIRERLVTLYGER